MRVGLIGQKWIGEQVLKKVLDVADVAFVAETAADLWRRALAPMGVELIAKAVGHLDAYGFLPSREQMVDVV